jgi:pimeloyl-ACP methyl ester carboxylesterase
MKLVNLLISALLAASAIAASTAPSKNYTCTSFIQAIPVNNVTVVVPPFPEFTSQEAATYFANQVTIRTPSAPKVNFTTVSKSFNISLEYCTPSQPGPRASTVHFLSHGIGFNRSYWDFRLPSAPNDAQYSYINAVTSQGYSTLAWNRLGIAPSTIADPYLEIQGGLAIQGLAAITNWLKNGNFSQVPPPKKVIHVGHSWGSEITVGFAANFPALSDGLILTGYSAHTNFANNFVASSGLHIANIADPKRFPNTTYSSGYLTWPDAASNQYSFLSYPNFDPAVLAFAEATKQPFTVGEFLTLQALPINATAFTKPVLYVVGEQDLIFCASNCTGLMGPESAAVEAFNASSSVETVVLPKFGHGINLHKNATRAYGVILDFLGRHGF